MGEPKKTDGDFLRRFWPQISWLPMAALVGFAVCSRLANLARLPFGPSLNRAFLVLVSVALLFALAQLVMERLGLVDKSPKTTPDDDEMAPRRPPPPIIEAATFDFAPGPEAPQGEETLTPLTGGSLPETFDKAGRRIVWRVETMPPV